MILDVGCGENPKGHVNIDSMVEWNSQSKVKGIKNFIIADGMSLPFRKNAFSMVICDMVLEHFIHPAKALQEFSYAADRLYIIVPNNPVLKDAPVHIYSWGQDSFHNLVSLFYKDVRVWVSIKNYESLNHVVLNFVNKIPIFRIVFSRIICRFFGLNIFAFCRNPHTRLNFQYVNSSFNGYVQGKTH